MKLKTIGLFINLGLLFYLGCSTNEPEAPKPNKPKNTIEVPVEAPNNNGTLKILSLGDSYTIGESVCIKCRFPEQLRDSIKETIVNKDIDLKIIARTGWTTTALISTINSETIDNDYNLVTLLIGVNNQFQQKPFAIFEKEFPILTNLAIKAANYKKEKLIVVSIPDYAYTPFGNGNNNISVGIDKYNNFIENYCEQNNITYTYITDITRLGIDQPELVASDGLHPSTLAYTKFVNTILPEALEKIDYLTN